MKTLQEQLDAYADYHRDGRNKLTHFVGVPLVIFALFVFLGWLRYHYARDMPLTGAALFCLLVSIYYLRLDWQLAPFSLTLLWLANQVSLWYFRDSLLVFLTTMMAGWAFQLLGHALEGKRPALADNMLQIFNAPLFLAAEVLFLLGYRKDLWQIPHSPLAGTEERGKGTYPEAGRGSVLELIPRPSAGAGSDTPNWRC
jgi:uncharacterized membrane protein YGL010W